MTGDPPITPLDYLSGVTVVDIGDIRVTRGMSRRHVTSCPHKNMTYDPRERRIWCADCEHDIEPFDAFELLVKQYDHALDMVQRREKQVAEAETFQLRTLAAKALDQAWRQRSHVPACPQCHGGLFPEDFKNGVASLGREYAEALRRRKGPALT